MNSKKDCSTKKPVDDHTIPHLKEDNSIQHPLWDRTIGFKPAKSNNSEEKESKCYQLEVLLFIRIKIVIITNSVIRY